MNKNIDQFWQTLPTRYPEHSDGKMIEEHYREYHKKFGPPLGCDREYLEIGWTNYYVNNGYGKNCQELQNYLNSLDRSKKYYTIVQYDDGIVSDVSGLDIKTFACCKGDIIIPVLSSPHQNVKYPEKRDIFASFVGALGNHPIRRNMLKYLNSSDYVIKDQKVGEADFVDTMTRSVFSLCPRGYGPTSFRMYEAIELGAIPVYIYDSYVVPHIYQLFWSDISVGIHVSQLEYIDARLRSIISEKGRLERMQKRLKEVRGIFTLESTCEFIHDYCSRNFK